MVSLEDVSKSYAGRDVIGAITLHVASGERLALVGPSGCGKSTLLRLILGLVMPDRGRVRVGDVTVDADTARAVRRRVGYVIQDGALFPHLTGEENVTLCARLDGWDRARIDARLATLLELVHLPRTHLARFPREFSGGERQRISVMRALFLDPDVLLLDEPLGALDPIVRARLQSDLRAAFDEVGKTVVLVTHDMAEAAYLAGSIAVMRDGVILQRGAMRELLDNPAHPFVRELATASRTLAEALG